MYLICTSKHYSKEHFVHLQQFHKAHGEVTIQQQSLTAFQEDLFFFFFFEKRKRKKERNNTAQDVKTSMLNICKQWSLSLLLSSPRRKQEEKALNFFLYFFPSFFKIFKPPHSVSVNETADTDMLSLISVYHFNNDIWNR